MSKTLTADDRSALIRLASDMSKKALRQILAEEGLIKKAHMPQGMSAKEYLKNPDVCPYCGSKDLHWIKGVVISKRDKDKAIREKECGNCGAGWYEDWSLTAFNEVWGPRDPSGWPGLAKAPTKNSLMGRGFDVVR